MFKQMVQGTSYVLLACALVLTGCNGTTPSEVVPDAAVDDGPIVEFASFPYGNCTWFVNQMWTLLGHPVTWSGDAGKWLRNAEAQGYIATPWPHVNYICTQNGLSSYGHVSLVIEKDPPGALWPKRIRVREMNYVGFARESYLATDRPPSNLGRWIHKNADNTYGTGSQRVTGFISATRR